MKKIPYFIILLVLFLAVSGCQRDDICPETTDTTPLLIIRFYDFEEPEESIAPQNLSINEVGNEEYVTVRTGRDEILEYRRVTADSIVIPLRTDIGVTELEFTVNTPREDEEPDEDNIPNTDLLRFTYATQEEYINRACAYKVNFIGLKVNLENGEDETAWMQNIQIEQVNIEDQNQAHVSIYF